MLKSIYIHIPFCEKKCNYCSFCSYSLIKEKENYLKKLAEEIKFYYKNETLETIYFGGGTPSLLEAKEIQNILNLLKFNNNTEITLELNPANITKEKLINLKNIGINRLSVGIQSFFDDELISLGRTHNSKEAIKTIEFAKEVGFNNISIDLMYGLINQDIKKWEQTLNKALEINPEHISLYGLKIEKGTKFYLMDKNLFPSQDIQAKMWELAINKLSSKYLHYEFSNFAKNKSFISKHNSTYWSCENYYGFGLSASGYIENKRYTNTFNFKEYINNPLKKNYEILSKQELIEEEIFLGLRLTQGINFSKINKKFNINIEEKYKKQFEKYLNFNLLEKTKNGIKLTKQGILLSNEVLCDFLE